MAGALESSITLDDVFAMVGSKRVPLAPELAGYLTLEVAEGADEGGGDIDPRSVYIAQEGTVALVKPREALAGNAEASVRSILGRLLDASGSRTAALTAAARRKSTGSLRALSEELEAALIPVNRAAGRRALARLAREVKRVTLGVGRNAAAAGPRGAARVSLSPGEALSSSQPPAAMAMPTDEEPTARREVHADLMMGTLPTYGQRADLPRPVTIDLEEIEENPAAPLPVPSAPPAPSPAFPTSRPPRSGPYSADDVDSLLAQFSRASERPDQAVARDLKAMAGLDPTPPPARTFSTIPPSDPGVEALLALSDPTVSPPQAEASKPVAATSTFAATPAQAPLPKRAQAARAAERLPGASTQEPEPAAVRPRAPSQKDIPTGASLRRPVTMTSRISTGEFRATTKRRSDLWLLVLLLALIGVGVAGVWTLRPGFFTGRTAEKIAQEKAAADSARQKAFAAQQAMACKATLAVADVPLNAEVLLREGQAPVDVEHMPVGTRLEFVATADGFAPKRTVVPAGIAWDTGADGKPRFEVAVQLDKSSAKSKGDVWPPGEPGSEVGGKGLPGTVHLVATPRGAEVWLLAGLGPAARVEGLPCDQDVDVLVAGPTTLRRRVHVSVASFTPGPEAPPNGRFARVSAK
jgi:hypothetical protein